MQRRAPKVYTERFEDSEPDPSAPTGPRQDLSEGAIPDIVIRRLPIYARSLKYLVGEGIETVSSGELGTRLGVSAAQIRRDLSYFGEFGKQGKGYNVAYLLEQINAILGIDHDWPLALVGLGHLGRALLHYDALSEHGFRIEALFDHNPAKIGGRVGDLEVHAMSDMPGLLADRGIKMAILAVPASGAQEATDALIEAGVRAILNYAPLIVQVPPYVKIRHIDPVVALQGMTYYLGESAFPQRPSARNGRSTERARSGKLD